jgi:hypothetical protein
MSILRFQKGLLMVSMDVGSMLFDSEWISLLASSVNEDEQGTMIVMKNTNGTRSTTTTTIVVLWLIHHFFLKKGFIQVSGQWKYLC